MPIERRKSGHEVTPQYEDAGIFKNPLLQYEVSLVPIFAQSSRQDLLVKGFIEQSKAIDVVFAGRRKSAATAVAETLKALWSRENIKARKTGNPPERDEVRLRVRIEGCWRRRFIQDDQGWQTGELQLFAARWVFADAQGRTATFGELPLHRK